MAAAPPDLTRRLELFLCDRLNTGVPGVRFAPDHGPDVPDDPAHPINEGPYGVPRIMEAEEINPGSDVYMVTVYLAFQTLADDTRPDVHSDYVRKIDAALNAIATDAPGYDTDRQIYINGLTIVLSRPLEGDQTHGTLVEIKVGCQLASP